MKKILLVFIATLFASCSVVRDNPVDKEGDSYVDPKFEITNSTISEGGVNSGDDLIIDLEGNTSFNLFQYNLDKEGWSSYSENSVISLSNLSIGKHEIEIKTKYSDHEETYNQKYKFLVVDSSCLFMSPAWVSPNDGETVELNCRNIPENVVTMHVKFNNVLIDSASLVYTTSSNVKLLYSDSLINIAVLPGGDDLSGSKTVASLKLKDFTGATVSLDVDLRDKSESLVECDSTFGLLIN